MSIPWEYLVSKRDIPGIKKYDIPGRKDSLSQTVLDDISQVPSTTVLPNPGGIGLEVVSSNAADAAAGTGVQTVSIHYLDTDGYEQDEIVELGGLTPTNTVATDIDKIQWIHAERVGTGGVAAGNITLQKQDGTTDYSYIAAGGNQSLSARYTVPCDKTGFITGWVCTGTATKRVDFRLRSTTHRVSQKSNNGIFLFQDSMMLESGSSGWRPFDIPIKVNCLDTVKVSAIANGANADCSTSFTIVLIDN